MSTRIHGHAVIDRLLASGRRFDRAGLVAFIEAEFGPEARFHTCSAEGLDAAGLVAFLAARGKFAGPEDALAPNPDRVCRH